MKIYTVLFTQLAEKRDTRDLLYINNFIICRHLSMYLSIYLATINLINQIHS